MNRNSFYLIFCSLVSAVTIMLFLLVANDHYGFSLNVVADFPRVVPERQQFFEYESIVVSCEGLMGLTGWRVLKKISGLTQTCAISWSASIGPCNITNAIPKVDSGEFWCEIGAKRSNTVNITVTAGSVILEGPSLPVMAGDNVSLGCREQKSDFTQAAQFFKDGILMYTSPIENMTIPSVSRSNEGLYSCSISGAGQSAQSWLIVTASEEDQPDQVPQLFLKVCVGVCAFLVVLLLVGLLRRRRRQTVNTVSEEGSAEEGDANPVETTYSSPFIYMPRKNRVSEEAPIQDPQTSTYVFLNHPR
nr:low affinity immunoglobulin gamma Fc region receptor II-b-like isoform X2 [Labrus bergylta]